MDRSLATLLRSLQTSSQHGDASRWVGNLLSLQHRPLIATRLLPSATSLLSSLSNPLNITLLSSHLLSAPALWAQVEDLQASRRIFSAFYTATTYLVNHENHVHYSNGPGRLSDAEWVTAVVKGADENSPRWRHLLLIGGVLLGLGKPQEERGNDRLRARVESALVTAANFALADNQSDGEYADNCVVFVLNHTFEQLADSRRAQLNYDLLLPLLLDAVFFSQEGLEHGYWLGMIDADISEGAGKQLSWSPKSVTFAKARQLQSRSLVSSLGPLSRLIAHAIENVSDPNEVVEVINRLADVARTFSLSWRRNKLSEIGLWEEMQRIDAESLKHTLPVLWQILKMSLFAIVIILRAALGRLLLDYALSVSDTAPLLAMQSLHILRNLYFISSRLGQTSSSQYMFVNLTAIDILAQYPDSAAGFLSSIRPTELGRIPQHPLDRCLDLFFLNTAEHFTLTLSPRINEDLLIAAALPYLSTGGSNYMLELFEAGHSLTLSVLASPKNADLSAPHLPFYIEALLTAFPENLSARQFRLAFKTVIRISAPQSRIAISQPMLQSTLLELVYDRALNASPKVLPDASGMEKGPRLSEQAVLVMAIFDSLCYLPISILDEWLSLTSTLFTHIGDPVMKQTCRQRMWEALSSGEMDVERASTCVAWWNSRGGREMVLFGDEPIGQEPALMSGALQSESKL